MIEQNEVTEGTESTQTKSAEVERLVMCNKKYRHTREFLGRHLVFYQHLLNGGKINRNDPLNNVKEILTAETIVKREGCLCGITSYGFNDLEII